eukprot:g2802.t1
MEVAVVMRDPHPFGLASDIRSSKDGAKKLIDKIASAPVEDLDGKLHMPRCVVEGCTRLRKSIKPRNSTRPWICRRHRIEGIPGTPTPVRAAASKEEPVAVDGATEVGGGGGGIEDGDGKASEEEQKASYCTEHDRRGAAANSRDIAIAVSVAKSQAAAAADLPLSSLPAPPAAQGVILDVELDSSATDPVPDQKGGATAVDAAAAAAAEKEEEEEKQQRFPRRRRLVVRWAAPIDDSVGGLERDGLVVEFSKFEPARKPAEEVPAIVDPSMPTTTIKLTVIYEGGIVVREAPEGSAKICDEVECGDTIEAVITREDAQADKLPTWVKLVGGGDHVPGFARVAFMGVTLLGKPGDPAVEAAKRHWKHELDRLEREAKTAEAKKKFAAGGGGGGGGGREAEASAEHEQSDAEDDEDKDLPGLLHIALGAKWKGADTQVKVSGMTMLQYTLERDGDRVLISTTDEFERTYDLEVDWHTVDKCLGMLRTESEYLAKFLPYLKLAIASDGDTRKQCRLILDENRVNKGSQRRISHLMGLQPKKMAKVARGANKSNARKRAAGRVVRRRQGSIIGTVRTVDPDAPHR